MKERPLIPAEQQVAHLAERGVRFDIMSPEAAIAFLRDKNFFFKVKAFAKCFSTYRSPVSEGCGRYVNLDFAYLAELTKLDHHLRERILSMTLDIEHYMKVHLNRTMMDDGVDGKEVLGLLFAHERVRKERMLEERFDPSGSEAAVERMKAIADRLDGVGGNERATLFLEMLHIAEDQTLGIDPEHLERSVSYLGDSNYTRDLANKYGRREDMYVWNYLELVSFGGIIALYKFYFYDLRRGRSKEAESVKQLLFPVKALRNAAAHNGNVLNTIGQRLQKPVGSIATAAREELGIDQELVALTKRFPVIHDFTALVLCFDRIVSDAGARSEKAAGLRTLRERFLEHADYFEKQIELDRGIRMLGGSHALGSRCHLFGLPIALQPSISPSPFEPRSDRVGPSSSE